MPNSALVDAIANLRAYRLPPPVSWWPPAFGWWFVALSVTIIIIGLGVMWWRLWWRLSPTRYAKKELAALQTALTQHGDSVLCLRELSKLLRRFALATFPRQQIARLIGANWLQFLDEHGGGGKFQSYPGNLLAQAPYDRKGTEHCFELINIVKQWVNCNKRLNAKQAAEK